MSRFVGFPSAGRRVTGSCIQQTFGLSERLFFIAGLYPRWSEFPFFARVSHDWSHAYPTTEVTDIARWRI